MTSIKICKTSNEDIINERIYNRNIPSNKLQTCISTQPVPTKYVKMPLINHRQESKEQIETVPYYNIKNTFNPGSDKSPYNGFASQINTESQLRNQFIALQRSDRSIYVPQSNSDLYNEKIAPENPFIVQKFPYLFEKPMFNKFDPNTCNLGNNFFNNNTRIDRQNLTL
tara:strand:+ start:1347 stop:1853 length:507 start_codon:yes stop_codon:yes gene_type:complete